VSDTAAIAAAKAHQAIMDMADAFREAERERIIALLDAWLADDNGDFDATLALIKGDKALIIQDNNLNYIMGDDK
jgi:hypothetical protein